MASIKKHTIEHLLEHWDFIKESETIAIATRRLAELTGEVFSESTVKQYLPIARIVASREAALLTELRYSQDQIENLHTHIADQNALLDAIPSLYSAPIAAITQGTTMINLAENQATNNSALHAILDDLHALQNRVARLEGLGSSIEPVCTDSIHPCTNSINNSIPNNYKAWTVNCDKDGKIRLYIRLYKKMYSVYVGMEWSTSIADEKITAWLSKRPELESAYAKKLAITAGSCQTITTNRGK